MSCSKPLPPFTFDVLCYLNRDQLERFSIVCRPLKNLIDRYFRSKPFRVFDELRIHEGSYALRHNYVQWHPNRGDYSAQQFLDGHECSKNKNWGCSFAEIRPYLGPTVRIKQTTMYVGYTYNFDQIAEMESIAYLWRDGDIVIQHHNILGLPIVAEDFQPILSFSYFAIVHYIRYYISPKTILNSPTILQCRNLIMNNAHFSYKDCKALYSVKVIEIYHGNNEIDPDSWLQFLDQPGVKPIVVLRQSRREVADNVLNRFVKNFSSAVSPNAFKIVFSGLDEELTKFRESNNISGEILELKKGLPAEYQTNYYYECNNYTLERSSV